LGEKPSQQLKEFIDYSPFHKGLGLDERLKIMIDIAVRCYTEPDVQWWMNNRQKSFYGMNAIDAAGIVNHLTLLGNKEAELITTQNQGYRPDGSRHPHTWGIVDNAELVQWFLNLP